MKPYEFTGNYAGCYAVPDMAMDKRHVYIVHEILRAWPFKSALELGSWFGASATAFVEAINAGSEMVATFCDVVLQDSLYSVASNCHKLQVRLTSNLTVEVLASDEKFDFVMVDASHDLESVTEELKYLLPRKPLCVMAHDTNATKAGYPKAEGAALLKRVFQSLPEYHCMEDCGLRPGEQTHRGLFLATTNQDLRQVAVNAFRKWTQIQEKL